MIYVNSNENVDYSLFLLKPHQHFRMDIVTNILDKYNVEPKSTTKDALISILTRKEYKKGEIILSEGKVSRFMYIVEKGIIRQYYYKDGRDVTEHFSCEGDIATCLESLFLRKPTRLYVEALEPSVLLLLDYEKTKALCDTNLEINKLYRRILEYKLIVSQQKADSWRFETSRERYDRFCKEYPDVSQRAPIAHIASYLLMASETLSRIRSKEE